LLKSGILAGRTVMRKVARLIEVEFPHTGGYKTHFLKIHQVTYKRLIANMQEVGILDDQRHEGDDRRSQLVLQGSQHTVVPGRVLEGTEAITSS